MNDATKEQDPLQAAIGRKGILFSLQISQGQDNIQKKDGRLKWPAVPLSCIKTLLTRKSAAGPRRSGREELINNSGGNAGLFDELGPCLFTVLFGRQTV